MNVGQAMMFQASATRSDRQVYDAEIRLADRAEPLGFDSIWGVEHHFTDYDMCPDVLQFLTYMAGRTTRVQLGSMVVVLPWHDPVRVAEQVAMLDALSGGRVIFGVGRGLGLVEFDGFGVPMSESRERFIEAAELVVQALETGSLKHEGRFYPRPDRQVRPAPFKPFRDRLYAAAVSPESSRIMAALGFGVLIVPQKPWEVLAADLEAYRTAYLEINGVPAPAPVSASWVFCDRDPARASELGRRWIGRYYDSLLDHYGLAEDHLSKTPGYEYYAKMASQLQQVGEQKGAEFFTDLHVYGTPEQCLEKLAYIREVAGNDTCVAVFSYGDMPAEEAERNQALFASDILPVLKQW